MAVHIIKAQIDETLAAAPLQGKHLVEPLKSIAAQTGFPLKVLEDVAVVNEAEIHKTEGDLWQCVEGEVEFICGGELVDPRFVKRADGSDNTDELKAAEIRGGVKTILRPGDWLWIPPGEPHVHSCAGVARLLIVKIPR